ncbi:hypothetical protein AB6D84_06400 [Vibrio lentus]
MRFDQLNSEKGVDCNLTQLSLTLQFSDDDNRVIVKVIYSDSDSDSDADIDTDTDTDVDTDNVLEYVVLSVTGAQSSKTYDGDTLVRENDGSDELGVLCIANGAEINFAELTSYKAIAVYLDWLRSESEDAFHISPNSSFKMENSYLFVHIDKYEEYQESYREGAPIWGGFSHVEPNEKHQTSVTEIVAVKGIKMPTSEHEVKLSKIISSSDGFERFLSKYHLLELLYDWVCVAKLRSVTEVKDFRDIMTSYGRTDILSLKSLLTSYVSDISGLLDIIPIIKSYEALAYDIFQQHSKDSNPIKLDDNWNKLIYAIDSNKLTFSNMSNKDVRFINGMDKEEKFKELILNVCSYWIYRIRCSIAHNKIGEYIFSAEDEEFVILFGEKILDEVINQVFINSDLNALMDKSKLIDAM